MLPMLASLHIMLIKIQSHREKELIVHYQLFVLVQLIHDQNLWRWYRLKCMVPKLTPMMRRCRQFPVVNSTYQSIPTKLHSVSWYGHTWTISSNEAKVGQCCQCRKIQEERYNFTLSQTTYENAIQACHWCLLDVTTYMNITYTQAISLQVVYCARLMPCICISVIIIWF